MAIELYNKNGHVCLAFCDLLDDASEAAVQCNQFLIVDRGRGALIDPGGSMTYSGLLLAMQKYVNTRDIDYILASHADPDIVSSLNRWFVTTPCRLAISRLWTRFVPHFTTGREVLGRILSIPDEGMNIALGAGAIKAVPAHFLHSEGNFHFYDPVSKILFTGDLGGSFVPLGMAGQVVGDFNTHLRYMASFHRRYMVSNKVCRLWVAMVRGLDVEMIVPQHGCRFVGKDQVNRLLDWIERLECGIDLLGDDNYRIPVD